MKTNFLIIVAIIQLIIMTSALPQNRATAAQPPKQTKQPAKKQASKPAPEPRPKQPASKPGVWCI